MDDNARKLTRAESRVTCAAKVERNYAEHPQETFEKLTEPTRRGVANATTAHRSHPGAPSSRWWCQRSSLFSLGISFRIPDSKASSPSPSQRPQTDPRRHLNLLRAFEKRIVLTSIIVRCKASVTLVRGRRARSRMYQCRILHVNTNSFARSSGQTVA